MSPATRRLLARLLLGLMSFGLAAPADAAEVQIRLTPQEIAGVKTGGAGPGTSGVSGVTTTVLSGDPAKPGPYSVRPHVPAHTTIQAHSHQDDRAAVVVSGTWRFGYGPAADPAALKALPAGSFYTEPAGQPHFAVTGDDAVEVIITGSGPTATLYVDPKNAPPPH